VGISEKRLILIDSPPTLIISRGARKTDRNYRTRTLRGLMAWDLSSYWLVIILPPTPDHMSIIKKVPHCSTLNTYTQDVSFLLMFYRALLQKNLVASSSLAQSSGFVPIATKIMNLFGRSRHSLANSQPMMNNNNNNNNIRPTRRTLGKNSTGWRREFSLVPNIFPPNTVVTHKEIIITETLRR
jgi:hypothetical protein